MVGIPPCEVEIDYEIKKYSGLEDYMPDFSVNEYYLVYHENRFIVHPETKSYKEKLITAFDFLINAIINFELKPIMEYTDEFVYDQWVCYNENKYEQYGGDERAWSFYFKKKHIEYLLTNNPKKDAFYFHYDAIRTLLIKSKKTDKYFYPANETQGESNISDLENCQLSNTMQAAIAALKALHGVDKDFQKNRTPKERIRLWLEREYKTYKLTTKGGKPSYNAINEIASVVNWNKTGGAPKTKSATKKNNLTL